MLFKCTLCGFREQWKGYTPPYNPRFNNWSPSVSKDDDDWKIPEPNEPIYNKDPNYFEVRAVARM